MKKTTSLILTVFLVISLMAGLSACGPRSDMPFNGEIQFHDIGLTIPQKFIRDSTESTENLWVFETGFYSQYILLSHQIAEGDPAAMLDSYADYLTREGVNAQRGTFLEMEAVFSDWTREGLFCQEVLFVYAGGEYAISLRGGTREDFEALLQTVALLTEETTVSSV